MTTRTVTHDTFTIERTYAATPARVFNAWADPAVKAQWFEGPEDWGPDEHSLDFRVGGSEVSTGGPKGGPVHTYNAIYQDIIPNERIVYTYEMLLDGTRISVSLSTAEFRTEGAGTRLVYTEQGVFLDGFDNAAGRKQGSEEIFDMLAKVLDAGGQGAR